MSQNKKVSSKAADPKKVNNSVSKQANSRPKVGYFSLFFASLFLLYEIANIATYFIVVYHRNNENGERSTLFLTFHILLHVCITILDISFFLIAFKRVLNIRTPMLQLTASVFFIFSLVFYVTYILASMVESKEPKNQITYDELQEIIKNGTITNVFFYSKGSIQSQQYTFNPATGMRVPVSKFTKCYSNSSILLSVKSKQTNERYHFLNASKFFYFQIIQDLNMSEEFEKQYYKTISQIRSCNNEKIKIKFLPQINKTFIVGNPDIPKILSHKYKMISGILGAGFYYDEYTKSIPFLTYKQKINLDVDPDFDFEKLWTNKWCKTYGKCDINNPKPTPFKDEL